MSAQPRQLQLLTPEMLQIEWNDGQVRQYSIRHLRDHCPCASCMEKRKAEPAPPTSLPVISTAETQPLRIAKMEPMGRYAYAIHFSDGHDTGLFTLESLRELGTLVSG